MHKKWKRRNRSSDWIERKIGTEINKKCSCINIKRVWDLAYSCPTCSNWNFTAVLGSIQGVTKRRRLFWLTNRTVLVCMSPNARAWRGEGVAGGSANEYSCAHGAQINFGDLTPFLTYRSIPAISSTVDLGGGKKCTLLNTEHSK